MAHLRSRGENDVAFDGMSDLTGSSPLTRGKRRDEAYLIHGMRLIPARAGKTFVLGGWAMETRGSSPLARGKRLTFGEWSEQWRLIPAHAGKTRCPGRLPLPRTAHPRSRGENTGDPPGNPGLPGSSPLARGKRPNLVPGHRVRGLIPARAGKTLALVTPVSTQGAHPRSRGENYLSLRLNGHRGGSSPLARGKRAGNPPG